MTQWCIIPTPVGNLRIDAEGDAVASIRETGPETSPPTSPLLVEAARQIGMYFDGRLTQFSFPLRLTCGTPFQRRVWQAAMRVPFGSTATYSQIAAMAGSPRAARAVGSALGANPLLLAVPCHRIVASSGPGGFRLGLESKHFLLELEKNALFL